MLRARPGWRRIRPRRSRVSSIWWTLGAVTSKCRFMSASAASWLNMVEIEIGVLRSQCLDRRIDSRQMLVREIDAWQRRRNASGARINWMFSTDKARTKMRRVYPKIAANES
jgi:hypothetical protein